MAPSNNQLTPQTLSLIRLFMLAGVVLIGGIFGFLASRGYGAAPDAEILGVFRLVFFGIALAALAGMLVCRRKWQAADSVPQKLSLAIVSYALAEVVAMVGAVYWFLGGGPLLYGAGLLLFGVAWLLFPLSSASVEA
jgi:hypothetical protein